MPRILRLNGDAGCVCRDPETGTPYGITYTYFAVVASSMPPHLLPNDARQKFASRWRVLEFCFETESFRN
ncbi:hypothetical protein ACVWXO_008235 [Bradyrhizobium sp. LM2.7]